MGLPVLMEKPFLLAGELAEAAQSPAARKLLMLNFNRRRWPLYQRLRELVRERVVGAPESATLTLHTDVLGWSTVTRHRLDPAEGEVLHDLGSQILDIVAYLFDDQPTHIEAEGLSRRWRNDGLRMDLMLSGGIRVACDIGYGTHNRERIEIQGSGGRLVVNEPNMTIHVDRGKSGLGHSLDLARDLMTIGYRGLRRSRSMARYSIAASISAFVEDVVADRPFSSGFAEAERSTHWLEAAADSLASGRRVSIGSRPRDGASQ